MFGSLSLLSLLSAEKLLAKSKKERQAQNNRGYEVEDSCFDLRASVVNGVSSNGNGFKMVLAHSHDNPGQGCLFSGLLAKLEYGNPCRR